VYQPRSNMKVTNLQGDSYSIIQTLTGGRFQPLDTLTKTSRILVKIVEDKAC
jgi:hypothetical protein